MNRLFAMIGAHALADYPLQGDFLAKAKNRAAPLPGVPWWQALGAHAVIHGAAVAAITKSPALGVAETAIHALTDDLKCQGKLSYNQDQAIHLGCKVLWAVLAQAIETRRVETARLGAQHESAVVADDALERGVDAPLDTLSRLNHPQPKEGQHQ